MNSQVYVWYWNVFNQVRFEDNIDYIAVVLIVLMVFNQRVYNQSIQSEYRYKEKAYHLEYRLNSIQCIQNFS